MALKSQVGETYITGQLIVKDTFFKDYKDPKNPRPYEHDQAREINKYADYFVVCPVCKEPVGLRQGYIDKYVPGFEGQEKYVHYQPCLSDKRLQEIADILAREAAERLEM